METKENHYNALKFFATILVVLAHSSRMYTGDGVINPVNASEILKTATRLIYSFHMPLFIAISGMVYGYCVEDLNKYNDNRKFMINKIKRLMIPYLSFGLLYVAPIMVVFHFTGNPYWKYCISGILLAKDPRHLWYLVVLFEIFIVSMLARKIIKNCNIYLSILILMVLLVLSIFSSKLPGVFQISNFAYYLVFFYLGYFYNRYYKKLNRVINVHVCIGIMLLIMLGAFLVNNIFAGYVRAIAGCLAFVGMTSYVKKTFMSSAIVTRLSKDGFGIYLFHPMIIYILYYYLGRLDINPIVLCLGISTVSYFLSVLFTEVLQKLQLGIIVGSVK